MKVTLMFRDRDFDPALKKCFDNETLSADLELKRLIAAMARDDKVIYEACASALFCPLVSIDEIRYRQSNLHDAFSNPDAIRKLYEVTVETFKRKRGSWYSLSSWYLASTFSNAVTLLNIYTEMLMELRLIADETLSGFKYEGFTNFLTMLQNELDDDYFVEVREHISDLKRGDGMLISAKFGGYLQGVEYVLRRKNRKGFWRRWQFTPSFTIADRDDAGAKDVGKRRDRAINAVINALAQSAEHLESFFTLLRNELAFYVGCLNLTDTMRELGMPVCIPNLLPLECSDRAWHGLYDISLVLTKNDAVVGNDLDANHRRLYIITGANQGGKSTFLRSVGQAQLMAMCGMPVGAVSFEAPIRNGVFSHFKKEEDADMKSGKLDEELSRMNGIVEHLQSGSLVLLNESFAATNEREGSEICRQITQALVENEIEVFSVTHLYAYAASFVDEEKTQYLRAERLENNERTFKVVPGEPLQTAFGEDLYNKIFN